MEMDNVNVEQVEETIALFSSMDLKTAVRGLLFLVVGLVLVRLALMLLSHMLKKSRTIPASAHTMIKTLMRILLDVVVVLAAANTVGIPITSFMVFLSVIGIAISLAVQGILSNFAGGILLLVSRPFAIGDFIDMREREGAKLAEDVLAHGQKILSLVDDIEARSPVTVEEYRQKLYERISDVLQDTSVDPQRILTEAAIFADKTAVNEETVRLKSHYAQLEDLMSKSEPIGRKLDFIVQEMNREANTTGSKVCDAELAHKVVEIKAELEKIREQIQNIE